MTHNPIPNGGGPNADGPRGSDDLDMLLAQLFDGALSETDEELLRTLLRNDETARERYAALIELHALLHWREAAFSGSPVGGAVPSTGMSTAATETLAMATISDASAGLMVDGLVVDGPSSETVLLSGDAKVASATGVINFSFFITSPVAWMLLAVTLGLTLSAGSFMAGARWGAKSVDGRTLDVGTGARESTIAATATSDAGGDSATAAAATLVRTVECRWAVASRAHNPGDRLPPGQRFSLDEGLAEFTSQNGTTAVVSGPASFIVESPDCTRLLSGTMNVVAASGDDRFEIKTSRASILGTGAEVAVVAEETGSAEIHALAGYVTVAVLLSGEPADAPNRMVLLAGEVCQIDPAGAVKRWSEATPPANLPRAEVNRAEASRESPVVGGGLVEGQPTEYQRAVLADRPTMYWNFDEIGMYAPAVEWISKSLDRRLHPLGGAKRISHAALGSGLALGRAADLTSAHDCFITTMDAKPMTGPWAIELWLQIESYGPGFTKQYILHTNPSAVNSTNPSLIFDFDDGVDNELELISREGEIDPGLSYHPRTDGGPTITDNKWRHILFVSHGTWNERAMGRAVEILVDGRPLPHVERNHFAADFRFETLLIGAARTYGLQEFSGRLDELAFYDLSAIKPAEISAKMRALAQRHIEAARPAKAVSPNRI